VEPVGRAAVQQAFEPRQLVLIGSHHQLAAHLVRNRILLTELHHLPDARYRQPRLDRARLVVKSAVEHAAVMPRLVAAHPVFLFEQPDPRIRESLIQPQRRGQPHDSAADNRKCPHPFPSVTWGEPGIYFPPCYVASVSCSPPLPAWPPKARRRKSAST